MRIFYTLITVFLLLSCQTSEKTDYSKPTKDSTKEKNTTAKEHPGKKLMEVNCYVCHSPNATSENRIAPPMFAVKNHYISSKTTKAEFRKAVQNWIANPTEENSKMRGAIKKFGLMPKTPFPKETIDLIVDYIFDNKINHPQSSINQDKKVAPTDKPSISNKEKGLAYALSTQAVLGKNLMATIQKEGTVAALRFCNEQAYPLTDSMAVQHNAIIKRVSDKPRNLANLASFKEKEYIEIFKKDALKNKESEPILVENNGIVSFYYPIKTNASCLQCHGKPNSNIQKNTLAALKKLYPNDKAIGYNINEVRGIWSISFNQ
ncbi:hypothetical protein GCM10011416_08290 [Polaribacter pacificus]|uniref:Cytochrome c domain-containing protein n=1 Tax=Polaribacter pacificus TaxID=1775173 RepID=A0A917HW62_9FLAO|nr:DUF3365 domain-containing protein [Polaribacter pacificus]GGG93489.1 hypothetical protein GCM10011416_08290 [Polaribacter pacificus]